MALAGRTAGQPDSGTIRLPHTDEAQRLFLITEDAGVQHVAAVGFVPSSWHPLPALTACGLSVTAIGSANYSSRPCPACLNSGVVSGPDSRSTPSAPALHARVLPVRVIIRRHEEC